MSEEQKKQEAPPSPIGGGWRGNISGHINGTKSEIHVHRIELVLDRDLAWALCNRLYEAGLMSDLGVSKDQREQLCNLGAALGALIDHPAANNGGRLVRT